ncbi:type IX secretion system sortase PorU [Aquimarina sp. LLG6339-5]|uniref:type IX secretion system sortase PorU n=1 Tax=Aquimarina sp. LLG6339-5 TaxID=3160830 RepID=UPI003870BEE0
MSNSVLAKGDWYKFYIEKTGIHKITLDFLSNLGMDVSSIDPKTIKIYGNGGQMLPLKNSENKEFDLTENAIKVVGRENGVLSKNDYILFYGQCTKGYNTDSKTHINAYDDKSYYFITTSGKKGNRIFDSASLGKKADTVITRFREDQFYEMDQYNLGLMGRRWLGDQFKSNEEKHFSFYFPNKVDFIPVYYTIVAAAQSDRPSKFSVKINQKEVEGVKFQKLSKGSIAKEGRVEKMMMMNNSDSIHINIKYETENRVLGKSYLDYIKISAERSLVLSDKQLKFEIPALNSVKKIGEIQLKNTKEISEIWDVTNTDSIAVFKNVSFLEKFSFKTNLNQTRRFIAIPKNDFYHPLKPKNSKVENQDLKGTVFLDTENNFRDVDYMIITSKDKLLAANRLANFHREHNNMNVKVASVHEIYNEFSSGKQDIGAIRNFIRYVYENASSDAKKLAYVCFLGNATFDYKHKMMDIERSQIYKKNDVPSFISYNSFSNIRSYVSDDFFAMMDPEEGEMKLKDNLDIALGRILVDTDIAADDVVNKIIRYHKKNSFGDWKNNILLLSDDVDKVWEQRIQGNLDNLGDSLIKKYPFLNISKVYSDAYIQKSTSSGERYPDVTNTLIKKIEEGVAVLDYFGHAEEEGFGTEFFFTKKEAIKLKNKDKLPLFVTVTCLATRFDNPFEVSVGEYIFKNPNGGAIGMIATTREIFMSAGVRINNKIINSLFSEKDSHLKPSEVVLKLKNELGYQDKRSVFFIGDPVMSLQMPLPNIRITEINEIPIKKFSDTIRALDKIRISGELLGMSQDVIKKYNGEIYVKIFDKESSKKTLGNNRVKNGKGDLIQLKYKDQDVVIYNGNFKIKRGLFDFEFVVPKDINLSVGKCKIILYAKVENDLEDVVGVYEDIFLGGLSKVQSRNTSGPEVRIFIDDKKTKAINVVKANSKFKIVIVDENGINVSRMGIGHQMTMIIDGNTRDKKILNNYFFNYDNDYKKGFISYPLHTLSKGYHTLEIKVWDVLNNSSSQKIEFIVLDSLSK